MNRLISYNGPLATSSFPVRKSQFSSVPVSRTFQPSNFPSSLPPGPLNHPLPPKPPTSKFFFHAYTPLELRTPSESTISSGIDHDGCVPVNSERQSPSSDCQIGVHGSPKPENIISLPSEDITQKNESDREVTSSFSFDNADPRCPDTFLHAHNHDRCGRNLSLLPRRTDDGVCHVDANSVSEVPETDPSICESSGDASVSGKDDEGLMDRCMLHEGEKGLLDVPRSKDQPSFRQVAETSAPQLSRQEIQHATPRYIKDEQSKRSSRKRPSCTAFETDEKASGPRTRARVRAKVQPSFGQVVEGFKRQATQHVTRSNMCIKTKSTRPKPANRKKPAGAALGTDEKAGGPRTRARARAEASEASDSLSTSCSARPYSAAGYRF